MELFKVDFLPEDYQFVDENGEKQDISGEDGQDPAAEIESLKQFLAG